MNKKLKSIAVTALLFLIWLTLCYLSVAFIKNELNASLWNQGARETILFCATVFLCFSPVIILSLND